MSSLNEIKSSSINLRFNEDNPVVIRRLERIKKDQKIQEIIRNDNKLLEDIMRMVYGDDNEDSTLDKLADTMERYFGVIIKK